MSEAIDELETDLEHNEILLTRAYASIANARAVARVEAQLACLIEVVQSKW